MWQFQYGTTDPELAVLISKLEHLIELADEKYNHSAETNTREQARADFHRGTLLRQALALVKECR